MVRIAICDDDSATVQNNSRLEKIPLQRDSFHRAGQEKRQHHRRRRDSQGAQEFAAGL